MKKGKEDRAEEILSEKNEERKRAIDAAMGQIEKQFGKGSIMRLGANSAVAIPVISTGSLDLDIALGIGGLPVGRIVEIYGPESSGKTTLMLSTIAQAQKKGGIAAFIDAEHALDPSYAKKLGVNIDDLLVSQPDNGEEALEICESLVRSNAIDIIVIDSVAALVPKAEIEGDMGDSHMGLQARLMSQALRKLTGTISKSKTTVVFINQIRMKIGVMFGSPETTTGGNALKFYASVRMDIRKIETLKDKEDPIGNRVRVKVVKNKCAPPFKQAEFDVMFNSGINKESSIIDLAVKHEIIVKGGSWYSYNGEKIGQGKETVRAFLQEHPDLSGKLEAQIRDLNDLPPNGSGVVAVAPAKAAENGKETSTKGEKSSRRNMALEEELESAEAVV
ncbi:MAG: recombinase RecA [Leptospiraceae bacterium]|nr:recombinase RecA [Leptospiraceae bacterium]